VLCNNPKYVQIMNECDLKVWIEENCPQFYGILNAKARKELPNGLVEYLESNPEIRRDQLSSIEKYLVYLVNICGLKMVANNYRRDLSSVNSENQVSELFCEIALCASIGEYSQNLELRPTTGKGTHSDCVFNMIGLNIYGEVKRYADPSHNNRSIYRAPFCNKPKDSARPRSMDIRSKLHNVHRQFPDGTLNILFVFHTSYGDTEKYFIQALFGDSNFYQTDSNYTLEDDGLFSIYEWQNISACCLSRVNSDSKVDFPFLWKNPHASTELPETVYMNS